MSKSLLGNISNHRGRHNLQVKVIVFTLTQINPCAKLLFFYGVRDFLANFAADFTKLSDEQSQARLNYAMTMSKSRKSQFTKLSDEQSQARLSYAMTMSKSRKLFI